ncbi:MAG: DUF1549 domain-containing protein [Planctomycetota bacterium]
MLRASPSASSARADDAPPEAALPQPALSAATIDDALEAAWRDAKLAPAPLVDDAGYLRRVSLDLVGTIPGPEEVEAFLADRAPDKRAKLAERLLRDPRRARHVARWAADRWIGPLDGVPAARPFLEDFRDFLAGAIQEDRSFAALAAEVVAAEGTTGQGPALLYAVRHGRTDYEDFAGAVARDFLGLELECARCHDHPFEAWKQADFHGLAAAFARTRVRPAGPAALRVGEAPLGEHRYTDPKGQAFAAAPRYPVVTAAEVRPAQLALPGTTATSRRAAFARWMASLENPWFARNVVDQTWERLFGAPLAASGADVAAPEVRLRARLARGFAVGGFSLRALERAIVTSRVYQRASAGGARSPDELARAQAVFAAARVRPLPAPELVDALLAAGGRGAPRPGELPRLFARQREGLIADLRGVLPERREAGQVTSAEALWWLNGRAATGLTRGPWREAVSGRDPSATLRRVFLRTLGRPPRPAEARALGAHLAASGDEALGDLFWALVATSEFASNH